VNKPYKDSAVPIASVSFTIVARMYFCASYDDALAGRSELQVPEEMLLWEESVHAYQGHQIENGHEER
jgi:hypothetical protein